MIKLVRCDDRLIHGQCVTAIIPIYGIKAIIAIDNATATNAVLKRIFERAAPKGVKTVVVTEDDSIPLIQAAIGDDVSTLILMRVPTVMERLLKECPGLPRDLNVASVPKRPNMEMNELYPGIFFSTEEVASAKRMAADGVHIWLQKLPNSARVEWDSIQGKF